MEVYIFGNGNINFSDFEEYYVKPMNRILAESNPSFILGDFRGADTLAMEYLKSRARLVTILHIGTKPRYLPDKYKTKVSQWEIIGDFVDDQARDEFAMKRCSHFIAVDFNTNEKRISGTQRNIEQCLRLDKLRISK